MQLTDFASIPQIKDLLDRQAHLSVGLTIGIVTQAVAQMIGTPKKKRDEIRANAVKEWQVVVAQSDAAVPWLNDLIEACAESREAWLKGSARPAKKTTTKAGTKGQLADFQYIVDLWNADPRVTHCVALNDKRRAGLSKLASQIKNVDDWKKIVDQAAKCRFTREDGREWIPDIDWLIRDGKAIWLLEKSMVKTSEDKRGEFLSSLDDEEEPEMLLPEQN